MKSTLYHVSALILFSVCLISPTNVVAIDITAPGSITGLDTIEYVQAEFGPRVNPGFKAQLVVPEVSDGYCRTQTDGPKVLGKIVLINADDASHNICAYSTRVYNAQQDGASFVIVYNKQHTQELWRMASENEWTEEKIMIPSVTIKATDGSMLSAHYANYNDSRGSRGRPRSIMLEITAAGDQSDDEYDAYFATNETDDRSLSPRATLALVAIAGVIVGVCACCCTYCACDRKRRQRKFRETQARLQQKECAHANNNDTRETDVLPTHIAYIVANAHANAHANLNANVNAYPQVAPSGPQPTVVGWGANAQQPPPTAPWVPTAGYDVGDVPDTYMGPPLGTPVATEAPDSAIRGSLYPPLYANTQPRPSLYETGAPPPTYGAPPPAKTN
eukprot:GFYU01000952.1.p1 GENE.GFYU01000952.1~~GFYU01000952.1.p1  ORF type:complete len:390 (+),score=96.08 GFYU01000952.1:338-1507(+)